MFYPILNLTGAMRAPRTRATLRFLMHAALHPSPLAIATVKASVAITLCVVLVFVRPFARLCSHPIALNSMVLVVIIDNLVVGQGFIFALFCYLCALVRYSGARYISFYLYAVLFAFQGTYTSIAADPSESNSWLLAYFQSYAWGIAIVLVVNLLCWPVSSEGELGSLLVDSMQHVSTLAHLTCKLYAREIDPDEKALITSSSALDLMNSLDPEGVNTKILLAKGEAAATFGDFRHGIDIVITDVVSSLSGLSLAELDKRSAARSADLEAQELQRSPSIRSAAQLSSISARLRREVLGGGATEEIGNPSVPDDDGVTFLKKAWSAFADAQTEAIIALIRDESLQVEDRLRITEGMPSIQAMYSERLPTAWTSSLISPNPLRRLKPTLQDQENIEEQDGDDTTCEGSEEAPCSSALTKSFSLLFGLGQLTEELCALRQLSQEPRRKRIRFHIFERNWLWWNIEKDSMTLQEALAALKGQTYESPPIPILQRFLALEKLFRNDRSLYAFKVALGATVYSVLLLAPTPRPFFIKYSMTSSLITVIVAIAPSLGQTFFTFFLYGLGVSMFLWGLLSLYPFYLDSRYYTGALLAANGAGTVIIQEWLYNELPELEGPYPGPALRAAQAIAAMCISIVIAALFQMFLFRSPARHQLRMKIAAVTYGLMSYNILFQSNLNCVAPADDAPTPPVEALNKIQRELIKRESKLQAAIIALSPLLEFASMEPKFSPFKKNVLNDIIRSHQIILDRLREGRTAVGVQGFNDTVHHDFASTRLSRTLFHLTSTSLASKTPLGRDAPSSKPTWASFENDALVLSRRLSLLPHGNEELHKPGFLRYWFYLVSLGAVSTELENLESHLGELFGSPETNNPYIG
ncbi:hypothetical protein RQP46_006972 [Phenoliferia psychrophenolica]